MNDDIRSALATAVGTPPPLGFTPADLIHGGRRRRTRVRVAGAVAAVVAVTGAVVGGLPALHRPGPAGTAVISSAARPAGQTRSELAARMDRAVRDAAPARLALVRLEVTWLDRVVDATGVSPAIWRARYLIGTAQGPNFNVGANERPQAGGEASCALEGTGAQECHESTAPDGTRLVILTVLVDGEGSQRLLHGVQNIRPDGTEVAAYVMYPRRQHAPLTDAQLIRVATDPAIRYVRPSDVGPLPPARPGGH